jgi:hypothetical protein
MTKLTLGKVIAALRVAALRIQAIDSQNASSN